VLLLILVDGKIKNILDFALSKNRRTDKMNIERVSEPTEIANDLEVAYSPSSPIEKSIQKIFQCKWNPYDICTITKTSLNQ
jgi:hypothetical protein